MRRLMKLTIVCGALQTTAGHKRAKRAKSSAHTASFVAPHMQSVRAQVREPTVLLTTKSVQRQGKEARF